MGNQRKGSNGNGSRIERNGTTHPATSSATRANVNHHTAALCSPTRACLLTGRHHDSVARATIAELAGGFTSKTIPIDVEPQPDFANNADAETRRKLHATLLRE